VVDFDLIMLQYDVLKHKIETKVVLDDLSTQHASKLTLSKKRKWRRYIQFRMIFSWSFQ